MYIQPPRANSTPPGPFLAETNRTEATFPSTLQSQSELGPTHLGNEYPAACHMALRLEKTRQDSQKNPLCT